MSLFEMSDVYSKYFLRLKCWIQGYGAFEMIHTIYLFVYQKKRANNI